MRNNYQIPKQLYYILAWTYSSLLGLKLAKMQQTHFLILYQIGQRSVQRRKEGTLIIEPGCDISTYQIFNFVLTSNTILVVSSSPHLCNLACKGSAYKGVEISNSLKSKNVSLENVELE
ncbi:Hypothetical_protein [Hexamita inflata]|uniref:Hypothetical_protein n=1 Tax=Hexamita inflata TaxID=28002 RepID=A0AA86NLW0_9EUKA|nr:Hypothetical protein HINF_LOCUS9155 [Hexamita inflata]CAI9963119.1 Hypothetical protein HINF_LOCUS50764 [Hexamita inflata]